MPGPLDVAVAVLRRGDAVLLQRRAHAPFAGRWELPGGKVLPGEDPSQAVVREAREELCLAVRAPRLLLVHEHRYPRGPWVRLHAFEVACDAPVPPSADLRWVPLADAARLDVLEGTLPVLAAAARLSS
jgi:8-oxo-dGTP diphosphatase